MPQIWLGREWDPKTGHTRRPVTYDGERHLILFGPNGSGKGTALEIPNLLRLGRRDAGGPLSVVSLDSKGENAAVTMRWRSSVSEIALLNPFNLLGLGDAGFNPLAGVKSYEDAAAIGDALQPMDGNDPFFPSASRDLLTGLCLFEVREAAREGRAPSLENVRGMLTGDLASFAERMVATGDFQLASLGARFIDDNRTNQSIIATAATATRWLLSEPIRASLGKNGIDWSRLKGPRPLTVYVILDADKLETFSVWLRLVVVSALNALYRQGGGGLRTLFLLSEFAQLGRLEAIRSALGQGRGYGVQLWPVLQDINQLRAIYQRDAANTFLGMSGATFAFTPNDPETAEWMSKRSGDITEPGLSASDDPLQGARTSWRGERRRVFPSDALFDIPPFHGLVWFAGQSRAVPVCALPYWEMPELAGRYDPNPYHPGSSGQLRRLLPGKRKIIAAVAAALLAAGAWLFGPQISGWANHALGPGSVVRVNPKPKPPARGSSPHRPRHVTPASRQSPAPSR